MTTVAACGDKEDSGGDESRQWRHRSRYKAQVTIVVAVRGDRRRFLKYEYRTRVDTSITQAKCKQTQIVIDTDSGAGMRCL